MNCHVNVVPKSKRRRAWSYSSAHLYAKAISYKPAPVAARPKAYVCGRSFAGIAGSNPTGSMDICLLSVLYVVR